MNKDTKIIWKPIDDLIPYEHNLDIAIYVAKGIKRKKQAMKNTESPNLKKQYQKSIKRDIGDLKFYCNQKNLSYNEVWAKANCPLCR
jgi:hypothetical protein